jgi:tungstate transport system substrate-binding protein
MKPPYLLAVITLVCFFSAGCGKKPLETKTVRVAVIGGMTSTGMWQAVAQRFEKASGCKVDLIATGEREICADALRKGHADLITMHSGDITTDLVSDGFGTNMRPWTRNDLVIVGPKSDPAGIRGLKDGAAAFRKIAETKSPYVDFQGIGSREMAHNLWKRAGIVPQGDWVLKDESHDKWSSLKFAQEHGAYIVTGRIPIRSGKLPAVDMEILVEGDPSMRRSFIVMEANQKHFPEANVTGAHALSDFLLSDETQHFLGNFGVEQFGGTPPFHPIGAP